MSTMQGSPGKFLPIINDHIKILMKKIAIIGCGISGLYFANKLQKEKKFDYTIFEKKSEIDLNDVAFELRTLLSEAATTNASDAEVAICVAYNIKQGKNESDALKSAGVNVADTITRIGDAMREAMKI